MQDVLIYKKIWFLINSTKKNGLSYDYLKTCIFWTLFNKNQIQQKHTIFNIYSYQSML